MRALRKPIALALLFGFSSPATFAIEKAEAAPKKLSELDLRSSYQLSSEPLTTEKVYLLDPGQPNPQLRRWVVARKMEIEGWIPRKLSSGLVGVEGGLMKSTATGYLRPAGPWYNSLSDFPCQAKTPDATFSTEAGAREEADAAGKLWDKMLSDSRITLSVRLSHVAAANDRSAWSKADRVFQEWLAKLDRLWRARIASEISATTWTEYRQQALAAGFCTGKAVAPKKGLAPSKTQNAKSSVVSGPTQPDPWMSQAAGDGPAPEKPLVRAPSRRLQGLFAIRMDIASGEASALGQLFIDTATPRSVLAPDWLLSQGVRPEWIEIPESEPQRVRIEAGTGKSGLAELAQVDSAKISGHPIPLTRYLLFDSTVFEEPETVSPCCNGVLGMDFLRRMVVEFEAKPPSAVQLWPVQGYPGAPGYEWVEVRENESGGLTPICTERAAKISKKLCQDPRKSMRELTGTMVFDLPHGKIWYSAEELAAPDYREPSRLKLDFTYIKGGRVLELRSLGDSPMAKNLAQKGLKKGMVITEIDGKPTAAMDLWDVHRRLAGVYGNTVTLKWKTRAGFQVEPFHVPLQKIERAINQPLR